MDLWNRLFGGRDSSLDLVAHIIATRDQSSAFRSAPPEKRPDINSYYFYINVDFSSDLVKKAMGAEQILSCRKLLIGAVDKQIQKKQLGERPSSYRIPRFIIFYKARGEHDSLEEHALGRYLKQFIADEEDVKARISNLMDRTISCWEVLYRDDGEKFNRKNLGMRLYHPDFRTP